MANPDSDIQGVAGYFEYRSPNTDTGVMSQLLLTPEGYTPTMQRVSPRAFSRSLNKWNTRPTWKSQAIDLAKLDLDSAVSIVTELGGIINRLTLGQYEQVGKPLLIELSQKDMKSVAEGKMPTRITNKIKTMRQDNGYPENLVNTSEEANGEKNE